MQSIDVTIEAGHVLHVGSGGNPLPVWLKAKKETTFDIDRSYKPDIVGDILKIGDIGPFDVVYASHVLEHVGLHDGVKAMENFRKVLSPDGLVVIRVPDLEDIKPTDDVVYHTQAKEPITGIDMYYGWQKVIGHKPAMQHKMGYVKTTLERAMAVAGFSVNVRRVPGHELLGIGKK